MLRRVVLALFLLLAGAGIVLSQEPSGQDYLLGTEEHLEMVVHIWGEVRSPGTFRVAYNTNLVELISIAGGPTKNAKLNNVELTRIYKPDSLQAETAPFSRMIEYNVKEFLRNGEKADKPPVLRPGDVVNVRTNPWYWTRETIRVFHEVALIASIYAWYLLRQ